MCLRMIGKTYDSMGDWLTDWPSNWPVGWMVGWLVSRSVDQLHVIKQHIERFPVWPWPHVRRYGLVFDEAEPAASPEKKKKKKKKHKHRSSDSESEEEFKVIFCQIVSNTANYCTYCQCLSIIIFVCVTV